MATESPVISSFKKRSIRPSNSSTSIRSLAASPSAVPVDDDDDEGQTAVFRPKARTTFAGQVRSRELGTLKKRLSFGGEDEAGDMSSVVTGSGTPRRLMRAPVPSTSTSTLDSPHSATNGTPVRSIYSKEYLQQLKSGTASTPPPARRDEYDDLTRSKFGSTIDDVPTSIPTVAAITEARERRERMRAEGGGTGSDSFISLDVSRVTKSGESRLVREEDELGDGDEDAAEFTGALESVPLGRKANKLAAAKMKAGMAEMILDAEGEIGEEDDEEAREWEEAQIKRGEQRRVETIVPIKKAYRAAPIPSTSTLPTLASLSARFASALNTLQTSHTVDSAALLHFTHEREELDTQEAELKAEVEQTGMKGRFFGDFKIFIEEVAAFLDEKHPALEKIEKENLSIQKERYDIVFRRRYQDDSDDVSLFTGISVPAVFRLDDTIPAVVEEEFDEMGRTRREFDTGPRSVVRVSRRGDRGLRTAARNQSMTVVNDEDGSWTDDDLSTSDSLDLASALTSLRESLLALFSDVKADDFRDPDLGIRKRFEEWRSKFGDEYANAFGGLALVGVWEFWARVEMALWNPFEIDQLARTAPGLDSYKWHANLASFGHAARAASPMNSNDDMEEDGNDESEVVVNALVASVVIPRLDKVARESFDPLGKKQTVRALGLIDEVSYCIEKTSPKIETLIQAFLSRIQLAITQSQSLIAPHLDSISLPSNSFDPSTFAARTRFSYRQLKLLENGLKWRRCAKGIKLYSENKEAVGITLDELLVRELVAKVMLPLIEAGWGTGGEEIAAKVLKLVPNDILPPALIRRLQGSS